MLMSGQCDYANYKLNWDLGLELLKTHKSSGRAPASEAD